MSGSTKIRYAIIEAVISLVAAQKIFHAVMNAAISLAEGLIYVAQ